MELLLLVAFLGAMVIVPALSLSSIISTLFRPPAAPVAEDKALDRRL